MKLFSTIILFLTLTHCFSQEDWTNYTSSFFINDVFIDEDDIWIGSSGGATRTSLTTGVIDLFIAGENSIKGGGISEIEKAPDGSLWFASENAGVFNYKDGEWIHYHQGIITEDYFNIDGLDIAANGDVWFLIRDNQLVNPSPVKLMRIRDGVVKSFGNLPEQIKGLSALNGESVFLFYDHFMYHYDVLEEDIRKTFSTGDIYDVKKDKNGKLFVITTHASYSLEEELLVPVFQNSFTGGAARTDVYNNIYWTNSTVSSTEKKIFKFDGLEVTSYDFQDFNPLPMGNPSSLWAVDGQGNFYFSSFGDVGEKLFYQYDGLEWKPIRSEIFPLHFVSGGEVQFDCNGNLWIEALFGVDVMYADGTWDYFPISEGNFQFGIADVSIDLVNCDVWIAIGNFEENSEIPGLIRFAQGERTSFLVDHQSIRVVEVLPNGRVYFFSTSGGLGFIENDQVNFIDEINSSNIIFDMAQDSKGNIFMVDYDLGLIKFDGIEFDYLGVGNPDYKSYKVFIDRDDVIWVSTDKGLMQYDGLNWVDHTSTFSTNSISGFVKDDFGRYWLSTRDGLFSWEKGIVQEYNIFNSGLASNSTYEMSLSSNGDLVISHSEGVAIFDLSEKEPLITKEKEGLLIYPNPSNGSICINLKVASSYQLFNINGTLIQSGLLQADLNIIDLDLVPGVYVFQFKDDSGNLKSSKVIISD